MKPKYLVPFGGLCLSALSYNSWPSESPASSDHSDSNWFNRVEHTKAEQPHWITPLITISPRLEEKYRYDQTVLSKPNGVTLQNNGNGKGLALIPSEFIEIMIGQPGYISTQTPNSTLNGWADESFLIKYRLLSANEAQGDYILTAFMGLSLPTGNVPYSLNATVVTPTIAGGKGWQTSWIEADIQSTLSISLPSRNQNVLGVSTQWNTCFQAHLINWFWPEIETSQTHWQGGILSGKDQTIMTYGFILGRIPLTGRYRLSIGTGYQTTNLSGFGTFSHGWVVSTRLAF